MNLEIIIKKRRCGITSVTSVTTYSQNEVNLFGTPLMWKDRTTSSVKHMVEDEYKLLRDRVLELKPEILTNTTL